MVFRAQHNVKVNVFDYWSRGGKQDDNPLDETFPDSCLRFDKKSTCDRHFRSYILDNWVNIDAVRYSLYKDGTEVQHIVFNGTNTTTQSWFNNTKVLSSSWTKLKNDKSMSHFSLIGYTDPTVRRTFNIFGPHNGCATDYAYSFIFERSDDACETYWPLKEKDAPIFLYSKTNSSTVLAKGEFELADAVAVFVKFGAK